MGSEKETQGLNMHLKTILNVFMLNMNLGTLRWRRATSQSMAMLFGHHPPACLQPSSFWLRESLACWFILLLFSLYFAWRWCGMVHHSCNKENLMAPFTAVITVTFWISHLSKISKRRWHPNTTKAFWPTRTSPAHHYHLVIIYIIIKFQCILTFLSLLAPLSSVI